MRPSFVCLAAGLALVALCAGAGQRKKNDEPKSQVVPLPPEPPMALGAPTQELDFHISPLLKSGGLLAQIRQSLSNLIRDTHGETIIKLRAFVAGTGDARRVQAEVAAMFREHRLPLPVLTILQVGALDDPSEQVVIEAVVSTHHVVNPNGLAFLFGQSAPSYEKALDRLRASTESAGVPGGEVLSSTCFTAQTESFSTAGAAIHKVFPNTAINVVQAVRDPVDSSTLCEAIARLPAPPHDGVVRLPGNVTLVNSPELVFTGLQLSFGSYLDDAHEAFERLQKTARAVNASGTPVVVDAFSLDRFAASALRKTNSLAPGAFSVQTIEGLSSMNATGGIEAVLAAYPDSGGSGGHGGARGTSR